MPRDFAGQRTAAVVAVRPGSLIELRLDERVVRVRLIGTYVPEAPAAEQAATRFLDRLLAGEHVYFARDPKWPAEGPGGPEWMYLFRVPDGLCINLELLRQGYARVLPHQPLRYRGEFQLAERLARAAEKGIWASAPAATPEPATTQPAQVRAKPERAPVPAGPAGTVYVTAHGKKYHRKDCQHARNGAQAISAAEARQRGLTPCARCKPDG